MSLPKRGVPFISFETYSPEAVFKRLGLEVYGCESKCPELGGRKVCFEDQRDNLLSGVVAACSSCDQGVNLLPLCGGLQSRFICFAQP